MLVLESLVSFLTGSALGSDVKGVLNTESPPNKGEVLIGINPSFFAGYREEIEKLRETLGIEFPGEHGFKCKSEKVR